MIHAGVAVARSIKVAITEKIKQIDLFHETTRNSLLDHDRVVANLTLKVVLLPP
jgi:hypothetical protein